MISGSAIRDANFDNIIHDVTLLNSLGVRLVIVFGCRPQIEERLHKQEITSAFHRAIRITDNTILSIVKEAVGALQIELAAKLSMGLANSPMHMAHINVVSGNYVTAKPKGIFNGIDYQHTGQVRKINGAAIKQHLDTSSIVLVAPLGYSPTGEVFNLPLEEVAIEAAQHLVADKLIILSSSEGVCDDSGNLLRELSLVEGRSFQEKLTPQDELYRTLHAACQAVNSGVKRCHIVSYKHDGALIEELFTRDGVGTLLGQDKYETIRVATIEDVGGILELIAPLEKDGILVKRSRELLESEITQFTVVERDGAIIACAALYPYDDNQSGELACVVTHPDYRKGKRAANLLMHIENQARNAKLQQLFVLTTQASHWFIEQGFTPTDLAQLPAQKQQIYNLQRNSKIFIKQL